MIDTHCHLTEERLLNDIDRVLAEAKEVGVERIIVPATSLEDGEKVLKLTEKYKEVYGLIGIHPENIDGKGSFGKLRMTELITSSDKIVGIGEIGMDNYSKSQKSLELQAEIFRMQLELAVEMNKPVVIHNREANKEIMEAMNSMSVLPRGQFHCWAGDEEMLNWAIDAGFYISFCGNITYKSASNLRGLLKMVPLDRLLLETDAPYLSPEGKRGNTNTPANVKITAGYIANLINLSFEELDRISTKNSLCLFWAI